MTAPSSPSVLYPLSIALGVGAAFVLTPALYRWSWPLLETRVIWHYSLEFQDWAPSLWWVVLALLVYGTTRLALHLLFALITLVLAMGLLSGRRRY